MNINELTQDKKDAITNVDKLLYDACLPTYTFVVESRNNCIESSRSIDKLDRENDEQLRKLLERVRLYIDGGQYDAARNIVNGLIGNRS